MKKNNKMKKNITLKINTELYDKYRLYCKDKGLIVSRQFEIFIEKEIVYDNVISNMLK